MKFTRLNRRRTGGTTSSMQLGYPVPRTPKLRVYRYSPNELAHPRHFILGEVVADIDVSDALRARMKHAPRTKQTVCPYSGIVADDDEFIHPDDVRAAVEMVKHDALGDVEDAIAKMLTNAFTGQSSGSSFLKITTSGKRSISKPKPRFTRRDLMRELICDHCGRDYGVFAIGLFCPDCGAPNLRLHFIRETELVTAQVALAEEIGNEKEELAYRLLGNAHEDVLTAFEATLKAVYLHAKSAAMDKPPPKVGNDFQNIDKAIKRFEELKIDPFDGLETSEMESLKLNIQKRHVIGHNLGVADEKFATQAEDAKIGETVGLVGEDIRQFGASSQKVIDNLDTWLGSSPSPTIIEPVVFSLPKHAQDNDDDPKNLMALDLQLSLLARKVGVWVAEHCPDGRRDHVDVDALRTAFANNSIDDIEEAIAELGVDGFVDVSHMIGGGVPHFQPTLDLYLTFDDPAFGWNSTADIKKVAELALQRSDSVSADDVFADTGWEIRRFNPPFEYLATQIPDGRVGRHYGTQFSVSYLMLLAEDRVHIKRLIARLEP